MGGHRCVATDLASALSAARHTYAANATVAGSQGGAWRAETVDWKCPPAWVFARTWRVVLGADLLFDSARVGNDEVDLNCDCDEAAVPEMHTPLLSLLGRLRF